MDRRKIVKDALCPICNREVESIGHSLWSCSAAIDVWAKQQNPVQKWSSNGREFFLNLEDVSAETKAREIRKGSSYNEKYMVEEK